MLTSSHLVAELATASEPDEQSRSAVQQRVDDILRPAGALARLDELAVWLASWQGRSTPAVDSSVAIIFAGDHGVTSDGVSAYPAEVTGAMLSAFQQQKASVSAMASVTGTSVHAIDVGVGQPTGNLRTEPAMTPERFSKAFHDGRSAAAHYCQQDGDVDLLIFGEMGIGNTTAAAAVSAALYTLTPAQTKAEADAESEISQAGDAGDDAAKFVGRGTGVDDRDYTNKIRVVSEAVRRVAALAVEDDIALSPLEILRQLGGTELAAIAGAMFEARLRSVPVLLDGYIATVPAVVLHAIDPTIVANVRAAHVSAEPGHLLLLQRLGLAPVLSLDLRLGEASGAVAAVPLLQMACKLVTDVPTFSEWFGPQ